MLQNTMVTAFTVSELFRENGQGGGGKIPPPLPHTHTHTKISVKERNPSSYIILDSWLFEKFILVDEPF